MTDIERILAEENEELKAVNADLLAACEAILEWLPHIRVIGPMLGGVVMVKRQLQRAVAKAEPVSP